jgi:hypothetical protein
MGATDKPLTSNAKAKGIKHMISTPADRATGWPSWHGFGAKRSTFLK